MRRRDLLATRLATVTEPSPVPQPLTPAATIHVEPPKKKQQNISKSKAQARAALGGVGYRKKVTAKDRTKTARKAGMVSARNRRLKKLGEIALEERLKLLQNDLATVKQ